LIRFLPDNVRAPLALTVSKPGAAGNIVALAMLQQQKWLAFSRGCYFSAYRKSHYAPLQQARTVAQECVSPDASAVQISAPTL